MNKHEFLPKMPNQSDLELVFDTSFHDVQPYLFKVKGIFYFHLLFMIPNLLNLMPEIKKSNYDKSKIHNQVTKFMGLEDYSWR